MEEDAQQRGGDFVTDTSGNDPGKHVEQMNAFLQRGVGSMAMQPLNPDADSLVLQRAIDTLPPKQQTAVILYYLHGYSLAESAEIAACNVRTMKARVHYALKAPRPRPPEARRAPARARGAGKGG